MMTRKLFQDVERTAWLSPCERYRHTLGRHWDRSLGYVLFIMLNPSTADAEKEDPTIRRCMRFAHDWGYGGIEVCNLFDWRATKPQHLRNKMAIAVSEFNDPCLRVRVEETSLVIAAWGNVPWAKSRIDFVFRDAFNEEKRWHCLRLTKGGYPSHPLYVPAATKPTLFW